MNNDSWINPELLLPSEGQKIAFLVEYRAEPLGGYFKEGKFHEGLDEWYFEGQKITYWYPLPKLPEDS